MATKMHNLKFPNIFGELEKEWEVSYTWEDFYKVEHHSTDVYDSEEKMLVDWEYVLEDGEEEKGEE